MCHGSNWSSTHTMRMGRYPIPLLIRAHSGLEMSWNLGINSEELLQQQLAQEIQYYYGLMYGTVTSCNRNSQDYIHLQKTRRFQSPNTLIIKMHIITFTYHCHNKLYRSYMLSIRSSLKLRNNIKRKTLGPTYVATPNTLPANSTQPSRLSILLHHSNGSRKWRWPRKSRSSCGWCSGTD